MMGRLFLFGFLGLFTASLAVAKEDCIGTATLEIIRANGESETPNFPSIHTYILEPGDSAEIWFGYMSGMGCSAPMVYVKRDGEVVMEASGYSGASYKTAQPGFYETVGTGFDMFFPANLFFLATTTPPALLVNAKAWLQGAYDGETGLMRDDLRSAGILPFSGYGLALDSATMAITGPDAVVDRVAVELRLANAPQTICVTQYGLIQRNGDIVAGDGASPLRFDVPAGNYYVAIGHRNHLRAMTAGPIPLDSTPITLDFRDPAFPTYGTEARKIQGDIALLWAGKASYTHSISYTGSSNDRDAILQAVGADPTHSITGYNNADVNMDGAVKYTGTNNDRDMVLQSLGVYDPTAVRVEQVP